MKYMLSFLFILLSINGFSQTNNKIQIPFAKFIAEDNINYNNPSFDDSKWITLNASKPWDEQGFDKYDGFGWYRFHVAIPLSLKTNNPIRIALGKADDACEVYFNGILIGKSGAFPNDKGGYISTWNKPLEFHVESSSSFIKWNSDNLISVRVYDGGGAGGLFSSIPYMNAMELIDGIKIMTTPLTNKKATVNFSNSFAIFFIGTSNTTFTIDSCGK